LIASAIVPSSFSSGWCPPATSMIESRRKPTASGPRSTRLRRRAAVRERASHRAHAFGSGLARGSSSATPHSPHMAGLVRAAVRAARSNPLRRGEGAKPRGTRDAQLAAAQALGLRWREASISLRAMTSKATMMATKW
jgi:hypothetical protein